MNVFENLGRRARDPLDQHLVFQSHFSLSCFHGFLIQGAQIAGLDRRGFILALGRAGVNEIQISSDELKAEVESELAARRQRLATDLTRSSGPTRADE